MKKWMIAVLTVTLVGGVWAHCGSCPGDKKEAAKASCSAKKECGTSGCSVTAQKKACCGSEACKAKKAAVKKAEAKKCCGSEACKAKVEKKPACSSSGCNHSH